MVLLRMAKPSPFAEGEATRSSKLTLLKLAGQALNLTCRHSARNMDGYVQRWQRGNASEQKSSSALFSDRLLRCKRHAHAMAYLHEVAVIVEVGLQV